MSLRAVCAGILLFVGSVVTGVEAANACLPIRKQGDFSRGSLVQQMVASAATIQVMRATRREFAWRYERDIFPEAYEFTFEPVETLKGWDLGPIRIHGVSRGAQEYDWAYMNENTKARVAASLSRWEDENFIQMTEGEIEPTPDISSLACNMPYAFEVGQTYLVFRDADGALMSSSYRGLFGVGRLTGPVIMAVDGRSDPWLRAVRLEVS